MNRVAIYFPSGAEVRAELVSTPADRAFGLMYRTSVPDGTGMLFDMGVVDDHQFWMKNTLVALDGLFLSPAGVVVGIVPNVQPLDETMRGVGVPSRYFLEVPAGWSARNGVRVGQQANMVMLPART